MLWVGLVYCSDSRMGYISDRWGAFSSFPVTGLFCHFESWGDGGGSLSLHSVRVGVRECVSPPPPLLSARYELY